MADIVPYNVPNTGLGPTSWDASIIGLNYSLVVDTNATMKDTEKNFPNILNQIIIFDRPTEKVSRQTSFNYCGRGKTLFFQTIGSISSLENYEEDEEAEDYFIPSESSSKMSKTALSLQRRIENFFQSSQITEARFELQKALLEGFNFPELKSWATVLSRPTAKIVESTADTDLKKINTWLNENASKYKDHWVVFKKGNYIDSDSSRIKLHNSLKEKDEIEGTTFICLKF